MNIPKVWGKPLGRPGGSQEGKKWAKEQVDYKQNECAPSFLQEIRLKNIS